MKCSVSAPVPAAASRRAFMLMLDLKSRVTSKTLKNGGDKREEVDALLQLHPTGLRQTPAERAPRVNESTAIKREKQLVALLEKSDGGGHREGKIMENLCAL